MSGSESHSASSGNAFSREEPEKCVSVGNASSTGESSSECQSCTSGDEEVHLESMSETVRRRVTTGEDIEPLSITKDGQLFTGISSVPVTEAGLEQTDGGDLKAKVEGVEDVPVTEVVHEGVPLEFAMDRLKLSVSIEDDLVVLREAFNIPASVTMRLAEKGKLRSAYRVQGETLVHPFFFGEGLRIPLPAYQLRSLAEVGLAISQLNPNTWRCLNSLFTLYHHCGFGDPHLEVFFSQ